MNTQKYRKVTVVYGNVKSMVLPDQSRGALVYLNGRYRFLEECH